MNTEIIVSLSIESEHKKAAIIATLANYGINEQIDQSTWYGCCLVELDNFMRLVRMARVEYELNKTDLIKVFYADGKTIKKQGIRIYSF